MSIGTKSESIKCIGVTKSGAACKRNALITSEHSAYCALHNTTPTTPTTPTTIAPTLDAPIVDTKAQRPKAAAAAAFAQRQNRKRAAIADSRLTTDQKVLVNAIVDKESSKRAFVDVTARQTDQSIMAYDDLIATSKGKNKEPIALSTRPLWINEKDWIKACKQYKRAYTVNGPDSLDVDSDGRYVLPLPLTAGRYTAMIATYDVSNVIRYSGTLSAEKEGYIVTQALDDVAPIVAQVYRAGAAYNAACVKLTKAIESVDSATSDKLDKAIERRDNTRKLRDLCAQHFFTAYSIALDSIAEITTSAEQTRAALLAAIASTGNDTIESVLDTADSFERVRKVGAIV